MVAAAVMAGGNALAEAKPLNLSLSGYYHFDAWLGDNSEEGTRDDGSIATAQDAEINFNMRGELDNGLKIGGRIELEASNGGDQIDQHWLTLESGWGRIDVGAINSGRYNMSWSVNAPNVAMGISSGTQSDYMNFNSGLGFQFRRPFRSANVDASNDDQGIHYYTPRFNGFMLALSYRPRVSTTGGGGGGGSNRGGATTGLPNEVTEYHDAIDIGLQYSGDVSGIGVTALFGYFTASAPSNATGAVANGGTFAFDDYAGVNAGVRLSYEGIQVGGMIAQINEGFCQDVAGALTCGDAADRSTEGRAYTVGASYGSGPWGISFTLHDGEQEDSIGIAGDTTLQTWSLGASYTLGPGVRLIAAYTTSEEDNEDNIAANGQEADAFGVGIALGF